MRRSKKRLTIIFTVFFVISILSLSTSIIGESVEDGEEIIAEWVISKNITDKFPEICSTQGLLHEGACLTAPMTNLNNRKISTNYGGSINNYSSTNWGGGMNMKYWQIDFSTIGFSDIKFVASSWSSSSGPRDFAIDYSIDNGSSWIGIEGTERIISDIRPNILTWNKVKLPTETEDKSNISIRIIMISDTAVNSQSDIKPNSANRLDNIGILGKLIEIEEEEDPEVPETPVDPIDPEDDNLPEVPETPIEPEDKDIPEVPEVPETPEVPVDPQDDSIPEVPEVPETPVVPLIPVEPITPIPSQIPETPLPNLPNPNNELKISIETLDNLKFPKHIQDIIGNHPIFDIKAYKNNELISNFDKERVIITIPYTLRKEEDKNSIVVYYIDENNNISLVTTSYYDESTKQISFSTDHLSIYAIGYNKIEFNDIDDSSDKDHISYLAARNIVVGSGSSNFNPKRYITRAEFIKILSNLGFLIKDNYSPLNFTDINPNDWYTPCIEWACENKMIYKINTSKFNPNKYITQNEMSIIISKFLAKIDYSFPNAKINNIISSSINHVTRENAAIIISTILQDISTDKL